MTTEFEKLWHDLEELTTRAGDELAQIKPSLRNRQLVFSLRHTEKCILALETILEHVNSALPPLREAKQGLIERYRQFYDREPKL